MVSFAEACLFSALEGEAKFWITLYSLYFEKPLLSVIFFVLKFSTTPKWLFRENDFVLESPVTMVHPRGR